MTLGGEVAGSGRSLFVQDGVWNLARPRRPCAHGFRCLTVALGLDEWEARDLQASDLHAANPRCLDPSAGLSHNPSCGNAGAVAGPIGARTATVASAFEQMVFLVTKQWSHVAGSDNGLQGVPKNRLGISVVETQTFRVNYAAIGCVFFGASTVWCIVHPCLNR